MNRRSLPLIGTAILPRLGLGLLPAALLAAILGATALGGFPATAAEDETTWSVAPANAQGPDGRTIFEYQADPGSTVQDVVAVTNSSATEQTFAVYAGDAFNDPDTGDYSILGAGESSTDVGAWISLASASVTIPAASSANIPFSLAVPSNATPGDHSAGIVATITRAGAEGGQVVNVEQRVGARIYLRVSGDTVTNVSISGLVSSYDSGLNPVSGSSSVDYQLANLGNTRQAIKQRVTVSGPFGQLASVDSEDVSMLLPGYTIRGHYTVRGILPLVVLTTSVSAVPVPKASDDPGSVPDALASQSASAIAVPWLLLLLLLAGAGVVVLVAWRRRRSTDRLRSLLGQLAPRNDATDFSRDLS